MLSELEQLAEDIACLAQASVKAQGTADAWLIAQVMHHLQTMLEDLCEREGMLVGPMPWWTRWRRGEPG